MLNLTKLGAARPAAVLIASWLLAGCTVTVPDPVAMPSMQILVDGARVAMEERSTARFSVASVHDDYRFRGHGDVRRDSFRPDAEMIIGPGISSRVIYVGGALYEVMGDPAILLPPEVTGDASVFRESAMDLVHTADPALLLDVLEAAGTIVGWEGEDELHGDKAQHYAAELALDALCAHVRSGASVGLVFQELVDGPSGGTQPISTMTASQDACAKSGTVRADVWVDEDHQIRQFELPDEVAWQDGHGAKRQSKRLELEHRNWGVTLKISAPEDFFVAD